MIIERETSPFLDRGRWICKLTGRDHALDERVARKTDATRAGRHVIGNVAVGEGVARSGARVSAFTINACHVARAFAVADTFRSAVGWRPDELRHAGARRRIVDDLALGIGTAGRRLTWVYRSRHVLRFNIYKYIYIYKGCASLRASLMLIARRFADLRISAISRGWKTYVWVCNV